MDLGIGVLVEEISNNVLYESESKNEDVSSEKKKVRSDNLAEERANAKAFLDSHFRENNYEISSLDLYKNQIDKSKDYSEIKNIIKDAKEKFPKKLTENEEKLEAPTLEEINEAKEKATKIFNENYKEDAVNNKEILEKILKRIENATSKSQLNEIIEDTSTKSNDVILKRRVDEDGREYFENIKTHERYYLEPNWDEESVNGKGLQKWELRDDQSLRVINNMSEPFQMGQLNYKGYHENADGEVIIDMVYSWRTTIRSAVWQKINLHISDDLAKRINWDKSYFMGKSGNLGKYEKKDFIDGANQNEKYMNIYDMQQTNTVSGVVQHTPIKLNLGKMKREEFNSIDSVIQSRITTANGKEIYTKLMGGTSDSNIKIGGYGAYTSTFSIPKTNEIDLRINTLPYLQVVASDDQAPQVYSSQNSVTFDPVERKIYIATLFGKGVTGESNDNMNLNSLGYRLAFDKALLDVLKEDPAGFIGYVQPSKTSGARAGVNPNNTVTGIRREDVNIIGDLAYVLYGPKEFSQNNDTGKIIYTQKGTQGFIDDLSSDLSDQQFTLTTFNVDSDSLKKLYPEINGLKPEMINLDTHASMVYENTYGMDKVSMKTNKEIIANKGDTIIVQFDKPLYKKGNDIPLGNLNHKETASNIALKMGESPLIGNLGIYPSSSGHRGEYGETDFVRSSDDLSYGFVFKDGIKLNPETKISIFSGAGGRMVGNSGKIFINDIEIARFGENDAKTSFSPRMLLGTESSSSALIDRTQYMPYVEDIYDYDRTISGYTYKPDQIVRVSYIDGKTGKIHILKTKSSISPSNDTNVIVNDKIYPENGKGLYKFEVNIPEGATLYKDTPIIARTYNYQVIDNLNDNLESSIGSNGTVARVNIKIKFDLNFNNKVRIMNYDNSTVNKDQNGNTVSIGEIKVPENKDFSNEMGYVGGGLGDNMPENPLREGYKFLGWFDNPEGGGEKITEKTPLEESTTLFAKWEKININEEYEPGYDILYVEERQEATLPAPVFSRFGHNIKPENVTFSTDSNLVTLNDDGSITISSDYTYDKAGEIVTVPILVTYKDGSTDNITAYINITKMPDNEKYSSNGGKIFKDYGDEITKEEVIKKVTTDYPLDNETIPEVDIKLGEILPDGKTPGSFKVIAVITYPDQTIQEATVNIIVAEKNSDTYEANGKNLVKKYGESISKEDIQNKVTTNYPKGKDNQPTISIKEGQTLPNGKSSGNFPINIVVTYPDKTIDETTVNVIVEKSQAETNTPQVKEIVSLEGEEINVLEAISNKDSLPEGTIFKFKETPDTSKARRFESTVIVNYPDTSSKEVKVPINVQKKASIIKPVPTISDDNIITEEVEYNGIIDLTDNIKNLPEGSSVEDITSPQINTKSPGEYTGKVKVSFKDGSSRIVKIPIKVDTSLSEKISPASDKLVRNFGSKISEQEIISAITFDKYPENVASPNFEIINKEAIPDGSKDGEFDVEVLIKYPDESEDQVLVKIKVLEKMTLSIDAKNQIKVEGKEGTIIDPIKITTNKNDAFITVKKDGLSYENGYVNGRLPKIEWNVNEESRDVEIVITASREGEGSVTEIATVTIQRDTDGDGNPDITDLDDDGDGILDEVEKEKGSDPKNNNSIPSTLLIEDIARKTTVSKEIIPAKVKYVADESLDFGTQVVEKDPVSGEKEITTKQTGTNGKQEIFERIITESIEGLAKVGNKKVEVKEIAPLYEGGQKGIETITTIYEVEQTTGKLINPKATSKKSYPSSEIKDLATKTTKRIEDINYDVVYVGNASLEKGKQEVFQEGRKGSKEITTVSKIVDGERVKEVTETIVTKATPKIISVGNKKVVVTEIPFEEKEEATKDLEEGKIDIKVKGKNGSKTVTTIYEVDKKTGELINPKSTEKIIDPVTQIKLVGTKKVIPAIEIEDIATKTTVTKEVIPGKVKFVADESISFGKKEVEKEAVNGEKEITTTQKGRNGKPDVSEKIITESIDGVTKVGNKEVIIEEVPPVKEDEKPGTKTIIKIYEVNPETGELINPQTRSKIEYPSIAIEDVATKTTKKTEDINFDVVYVGNASLEKGKQKVFQEGKKGTKEIITISEVIDGKRVEKSNEEIITKPTVKIIYVGNKEINIEELDYETIEIRTNELEVGQSEVIQNGIKGTKIVTTIYEVDRNIGELMNPKSTEKIEKPINEIKLIGTKKVIPAKEIEDVATKTTKKTEEIYFDVVYVGNASLKKGKQEVFQEGKNGSKEIITTSKIVDGKRVEEIKENVIEKATPKIISVGNKEVTVEEIPFEVIEQATIELEEGKTETKVEGKNGSKIVTTIYEVNSETGELINPTTNTDIKNPEDRIVLVGTKKVISSTPIIDIARKTTKTTEAIKADTKYKADDSLTFGEKKVEIDAKDGEKTITTVTEGTKGKVISQDEEITKEAIEGLVKVGNRETIKDGIEFTTKRIETDELKEGEEVVKQDGSPGERTTETVYEVNPKIGELINPVTTVNEVNPLERIILVGTRKDDKGDSAISYPIESHPIEKTVGDIITEQEVINAIKVIGLADDKYKVTINEGQKLPSTEKLGDAIVELTVTFEDGTTEDVKVWIIIKENETPGTDEPGKEEKTYAEKTTPIIPSEKTEVKDKEILTEEERSEVKEKIRNSNKDNFPEGTKVEIGENGDATITYPDGSEDSIDGKDLVVERKDESDKPGINELGKENPGIDEPGTDDSDKNDKHDKKEQNTEENTKDEHKEIKRKSSKSKKVEKEKPKSTNVKIGVGSVTGIISGLVVSIGGLFATSKRKNK